MSIKVTLILFVFTIGISCNSQAIKEQCSSYLLFSEGLALSSKTPKEETKKSITSFFLALDKSDYQQAYNILDGSISLQKDSLNRYTLLKPLLGTTNKETYYLTYRLQQCLGNIPEITLNNEVTRIYSSEQNPTESASCLNTLAEIEFDFLSFYSLHDSTRKGQQIKKIEKYLIKYPKSLRVQFLYGKLNYNSGFYHIALPIFHSLLQKKYYEKPILESMSEFYFARNKDSAQYYAKLFWGKFPKACNLVNLSVLTEQNEDSLFMKECEKCLKSESFTDSIKAKIEMARFNLNKRDFIKVTKLYNDYKKKNKDFTFNELKIWETGEYYDIFLRSLFLQKKYRDLYDFSQNEMGYNKKIDVENERDFYQLIKKYFSDYYEAQSIEFDKFYNENFYWVKGIFQA